MWLPRDIARYLEGWGYHPSTREDFGDNFLSRRVAHVSDQTDDARQFRTFVSLCAVPRGRPRERIVDLADLDKWFDPDTRQYEPKGLWLPFRDGSAGKKFTSHGILRVESTNEPGELEKYVLVSRDGYVEYGRIGGWAFKGRAYYYFAPLVAWLQRFGAFTLDIASQLDERPDYWIVLNMTRTDGASLSVLGSGWREPTEWHGGEGPPRAVEEHIQIARILDDSPDMIARWFAERIANSFGEGETRCFNQTESPQAGPVGELPRNQLGTWD